MNTQAVQLDEREARCLARKTEREEARSENIEKINDFINQHDMQTVCTVFSSLIDIIKASDISDKNTILQRFRSECAAIENIKFVYYMQLLRIAITGQLVGANILDIMQFKLLGGKQEIIKRLKYYRDCFNLERIKANENQ